MQEEKSAAEKVVAEIAAPVRSIRYQAASADTIVMGGNHQLVASGNRVAFAGNHHWVASGNWVAIGTIPAMMMRNHVEVGPVKKVPVVKIVPGSCPAQGH